MAQDIAEITASVDENLALQEGYNDDSKISHVENLFIIAYLTKALQDVLMQKARFLQYPLLLVDFPLALAILIVNVERILYVKVLGYILAHIQFDINILKSMLLDRNGEGTTGDWKEKAFDFVRKLLRFLWGVIILCFILPIWPLIWIYDFLIQTILIAVIYYFLLFWHWNFSGAFVPYYLLLATVTFLVASITVPFIFQLSVYVKALFSLERKTWREVHLEAKTSFLRFYQRLYGNYAEAMAHIKIHYAEKYKAEGGVYYMLLKFLHFLKDRLWQLKEGKIDVVVEKIQDKTIAFVDEYREEKNAYSAALQSISGKDLRRTIVAFSITIVLAILLVQHGSRGEGIIGPVLRSFVNHSDAQTLWVNHHAGHGYYEDMVASYFFLPNFLKYMAIGADSLLNYFFQAYYYLAPLYLDFISRYYLAYYHALTNWILYNF